LSLAVIHLKAWGIAKTWIRLRMAHQDDHAGLIYRPQQIFIRMG
jgi:hypothetical protein